MLADICCFGTSAKHLLLRKKADERYKNAEIAKQKERDYLQLW